MSFMTVSCSVHYSRTFEEANKVSYFDEKKAKRIPIIDIQKDNKNNIIVFMKEKKSTPQYEAEKVATIRRSVDTAPMWTFYMIPILGQAWLLADVTGIGHPTTKIAEKVTNEKATGEVTEKISSLINHALTVRINNLISNKYWSDKDGIVKIPIKALARRQPATTEKMQIDLVTELDGESTKQSILLNKEDFRNLALDSIIWGKYSSVNVEPRKNSKSGTKGFGLVQTLVKNRMAEALEEYRQLPLELKTELETLKSSRPIPPKLEKDQFESTSNFQKRVGQAKTEYERDVTAYNKKVQDLQFKMNLHQQATRDLPAGIRDQIIEDAFLEVFGQPKIANPRYDADTQMFFVDVVSASDLSGGFKRTLSLTETISNMEARDFYNSIRDAGEPIVEFKINKGQILWSNALVIVKGKAYAANPTDVVFKPLTIETQIAETQMMKPVDLKDYAMNIGTANDIMQVTFQQDPEIAKLQNEIYEKKKEKVMNDAKQKEIARLEEELKLLQHAGDEKEAPFGTIDLEQNIPKTAKINKRAVAVIIGNYNYKNIQKVTFARRDATTMKEYLIKTFGYDPTNIIFLIDASLADMVNALGSDGFAKRSKLSSYMRAGSDIFVYYSGHGAPGLQDKKGYLVPIDANPNNIEMTGYSLETLYRNLESLKASKVTVVIDACFSGNSQAGMIFKNASPIFPESKSEKLHGGVVMTSSSGDQISSWYPEKKHSLFTYYLLRAIKEKAAKKDTVVLSDLKDYVSERVDRKAKQLYNRIQMPSFDGDPKEKLIEFK